MRYVMSDVHGEYSLFVRLLEKIRFSQSDELYICGDILEKGQDSVKLAKLIFSMPNVRVIMGNHEDSFVRYYNALMSESEGDYDAVLSALKEYINGGVGDGYLLEWDVVDQIESLPYFIETEDFICIHAGLSLNGKGEVPPPESIPVEELVTSRRFKEPDVIPKNSKCVFFGHTPTASICGESKIIGYKKRDSRFGDIRDYAKIHLDTGAVVSGVLGCFCVENCKTYYVKRNVI